MFAGTGAVGRYFKPQVKSVIANDLEYYSFVLNRHYIQNNTKLDSQEAFIELNKLEPFEGFIFKNYSLGGRTERNYFSSNNAGKIDAIRSKLEYWKPQISEDLYFFLLASLLESADKIANTASVYGAYLKHIKKTAAKNLILKPSDIIETGGSHLVFHKDANELIKDIKGDVLYLDPPYNARQYGANYHLLNTIAKYEFFEPKGVTGLPEYNKSQYCSSKEVYSAFKGLLSNARFKHIFISYNNEGLLSQDELIGLLKEYGSVSVSAYKYNRFKADKTANRNHKAKETTEFLFYLRQR